MGLRTNHRSALAETTAAGPLIVSFLAGVTTTKVQAFVGCRSLCVTLEVCMS